MDRLADLLTFLFQENHINRSIIRTKYHLYVAFVAILLVVVKVAGYFLAFLFGEWVDTISTAIVLITLFAVFGILVISGLRRRLLSPPTYSGQHESAHRQAVKRRHPLEKYFIAPRRIRIASKADWAATKMHFPYQKKAEYLTCLAQN